MRPYSIIKKCIPFCLGLLLFTAFACINNITPPASMRFSANITILDTTATNQDTLVSDATVTIKSITYGETQKAKTDENGVAVFHNLLPDRYNILANGKSVSLVKTTIFNGQLQDTSLYIENNDTLELNVIVQTSSTSSLVISEVYYSGAKSIIPTYFHDQFVEIYNQTNQTLYLDSLIIADVSYGCYDDTLLESEHVRMFPGDGDDYPIAPGQFIVVAQDAIDHSIYPINSVDLSHADFEHYCADIGDVDNIDVPNTIQIHKKYSGADVLYSTLSDAIVLIDKIKDPYQWGYTPFDNPDILLPKSKVLDGVEYQDNTSDFDNKYLDPSIDGGIAGGIPRYSTKSIERNIESIEDGRIIFMDNNNSSLDFKVLNFPTPWYAEGSE